MSNTPSNSDDVIDSRDVIARIEELEVEAADLDGADRDTWNDSDEGIELMQLKALAEEAEGCAADWHYGVTLIRDSYFKTYAQELANDIGAIKSDAQWPMSCIDWDQAASELQMDYTSVDFDGVTYWVR